VHESPYIHSFYLNLAMRPITTRTHTEHKNFSTIKFAKHKKTVLLVLFNQVHSYSYAKQY